MTKSEIRQVALNPEMNRKVKMMREYLNESEGLELTDQDVIRKCIRTNSIYKDIERLTAKHKNNNT